MGWEICLRSVAKGYGWGFVALLILTHHRLSRLVWGCMFGGIDRGLSHATGRIFVDTICLKYDRVVLTDSIVQYFCLHPYFASLYPLLLSGKRASLPVVSLLR